MINCPNCKRLMEVCMKRKDNSYYQLLCRNCLCYWNMNKIKMTDDDVRELTSELEKEDKEK